MEDREFLCSLYNKDLVDRAIEESKGFYKEFEAEQLYKMAKLQRCFLIEQVLLKSMILFSAR